MKPSVDCLRCLRRRPAGRNAIVASRSPHDADSAGAAGKYLHTASRKQRRVALSGKRRVASRKEGTPRARCCWLLLFRRGLLLEASRVGLRLVSVISRPITLSASRVSLRLVSVISRPITPSASRVGLRHVSVHLVHQASCACLRRVLVWSNACVSRRTSSVVAPVSVSRWTRRSSRDCVGVWIHCC